MRSQNQSPKLRAIFTANTVRGMRYPLRRTIKTAPRNIVTNEIQQGHYTCTPSITIGDGESWLLSSMCLGCHVHVVLSAFGMRAQGTALIESNQKFTRLLAAGKKTRGISGEYVYGIEGPEPPRPLPVPFDPPFMFSSPTKKMHGSGTYDGMFHKPIYAPQGPPARWAAFEHTGQRMIAQTLYPIQVLLALLLGCIVN
jgi:hypothetical protein